MSEYRYTYRRGTTVFVVSGEFAGTVGTVTGSAFGRIYIDWSFGPHSHKLVIADAADVRKAPHPLNWYQRVQSGTHRCDGCEAIEAEKAAGR